MVNEEELQQRVEAGNVDSGLDSRAYEKVFRVLAVQNVAPLSISFADNVVRRVTTKRRTKVFIEEYLILMLSVMAITAAGAYCIATSQLKFNLGFLSGLSSYAGLLGFGLIFIIVLNVLERELLHKSKKAKL